MNYKFIIAVSFLIVGLLYSQQSVFAGITVNTNVSSIRALQKLNDTQKKLGDIFKKLSSVSANGSDDAAGLGVSESLQVRLQSLVKSRTEVLDAISIIQTTEKASNEVSNIIKRMRELAVQSASETLSDTERAYIQDEFSQLSDEISRIESVTSFNGISFDDENVGDETVTRKAGKLFFQNLDDIRGEFQGLQLTEEDDSSYRSDLLDSFDEAIKEINATQRDVEKTANKILKDAEKRLVEAQKDLTRLTAEKKTKKTVKPKQQRCGIKGLSPCKPAKK